MLIKYTIQNTFQTVTGQTFTVSGDTVGPYKSINLPIPMEFFPIDYSEDIQKIVESEREKAINPTFDAETIKYKYREENNIAVNSGKGLLIKFRFWNPNTYNYVVDYTAADFNSLDINKKRNGFKKSFFRLYFYDTNSGETNNLIFTEDLDVSETVQPIISFNGLYWLRNDEYFLNNNNNRVVYMEARFFNAKTGKVHRFINTPITITTPISITQYSNVNNRSWRTSAIELVNPKLNNGNYNFKPYIPFGANTSTVITFSEFMMT